MSHAAAVSLAEPRAAASPWTRADAVLSAAFIVVGTVVWIVGWHRVSGRASMAAQISPLNLAVAGMVVVGAGQAMWFLAGRRAVGARRRALLALRAQPAPAAPARALQLAVSQASYVGGERFYHRPECVLVVDRNWAPTSEREHVDAGRVPCGVCTP